MAYDSFYNNFVLVVVASQRNTLKDYTSGFTCDRHDTFTLRQQPIILQSMLFCFRNLNVHFLLFQKAIIWLQLQYGIKLLRKLCNRVNIIYILIIVKLHYCLHY